MGTSHPLYNREDIPNPSYGFRTDTYKGVIEDIYISNDTLYTEKDTSFMLWKNVCGTDELAFIDMEEEGNFEIQLFYDSLHTDTVPLWNGSMPITPIHPICEYHNPFRYSKSPFIESDTLYCSLFAYRPFKRSFRGSGVIYGDTLYSEVAGLGQVWVPWEYLCGKCEIYMNGQFER